MSLLDFTEAGALVEAYGYAARATERARANARALSDGNAGLGKLRPAWLAAEDAQAVELAALTVLRTALVGRVE